MVVWTRSASRSQRLEEQSQAADQERRIIALDGLVCGIDRSAPAEQPPAAEPAASRVAPRFASGALRPPEVLGDTAEPGAYIRRYLAHLLR